MLFRSPSIFNRCKRSNFQIRKFLCHTLKTSYQQSMVTSTCNHTCATVQGFLRSFRGASCRSPPLTKFGDSIRHAIDSRFNAAMLELKWYSVADREICGPYKKQVDAFQGSNVFHTFDCLAVLNLKSKKSFCVGVLHMCYRVNQHIVRIDARNRRIRACLLVDNGTIRPIVALLLRCECAGPSNRWRQILDNAWGWNNLFSIPAPSNPCPSPGSRRADQLLRTRMLGAPCQTTSHQIRVVLRAQSTMALPLCQSQRRVQIRRSEVFAKLGF